MVVIPNYRDLSCEVPVPRNRVRFVLQGPRASQPCAICPVRSPCLTTVCDLSCEVPVPRNRVLYQKISNLVNLVLFIMLNSTNQCLAHSVAECLLSFICPLIETFTRFHTQFSRFNHFSEKRIDVW